MSRKNSRATKVRRHRSGEGWHPQNGRRYPKLERLNALNDTVRPVGMCGQKFKFDTEQNAASALLQAQQSHEGTDHIEKRYYDCDRCDGYHLTSREKAPQREDHP